MTKEIPIEKMPAGRKLDWLVAEKVMGIKKAEFDANWKTKYRYSSQNAEALMVAEKLKDDGCEVHLTLHRNPFRYWCQIYWPRPREKWTDPKAKINHSMRRKRCDNDDFKVWASYVETLPLAICRTAIKCVEVWARIREEDAKPPPPISEAQTLVAKFFDGDGAKTLLWMTTKNPLLGNLSPREMIQMGREDKLLKFVKESLAENERPEGTKV